jgi:hypothetical protein
VGGKPRDEMDMMEFVDFVLAWDHRSHPAALHYFFSIFDLQHRVRGTDKQGAAEEAAGRWCCGATCVVATDTVL